ncbi:hypothetical protein A1O3_08034 [Capronia epimyces CBS 606.96]|uniref:Uncharacterized protein n=1 Tax=Capronia epimyces CBS 606.96 TaxID=1182542 RepID=W9XRY5_9EURO|nr:uncharacterized protein A1O3_08034 [Capronia epimyces CBS 606.96]EXJ79751.1 hypothetical protein A1O3_08034 [Capronia epimyces CBS 606.96]
MSIQRIGFFVQGGLPWVANSIPRREISTPTSPFTSTSIFPSTIRKRQRRVVELAEDSEGDWEPAGVSVTRGQPQPQSQPLLESTQPAPLLNRTPPATDATSSPNSARFPFDREVHERRPVETESRVQLMSEWQHNEEPLLGVDGALGSGKLSSTAALVRTASRHDDDDDEAIRRLIKELDDEATRGLVKELDDEATRRLQRYLDYQATRRQRKKLYDEAAPHLQKVLYAPRLQKDLDDEATLRLAKELHDETIRRLQKELHAKAVPRLLNELLDEAKQRLRKLFRLHGSD